MSAVSHRVTAGFAELQGIGAGVSGKPETPLPQGSEGVCFGADGLCHWDVRWVGPSGPKQSPLLPCEIGEPKLLSQEDIK